MLPGLHMGVQNASASETQLVPRTLNGDECGRSKAQCRIAHFVKVRMQAGDHEKNVEISARTLQDRHGCLEALCILSRHIPRYMSNLLSLSMLLQSKIKSCPSVDPAPLTTEKVVVGHD